MSVKDGIAKREAARRAARQTQKFDALRGKVEADRVARAKKPKVVETVDELIELAPADEAVEPEA